MRKWVWMERCWTTWNNTSGSWLKPLQLSITLLKPHGAVDQLWNHYSGSSSNVILKKCPLHVMIPQNLIAFLEIRRSLTKICCFGKLLGQPCISATLLSSNLHLYHAVHISIPLRSFFYVFLCQGTYKIHTYIFSIQAFAGNESHDLGVGNTTHDLLRYRT